MFLGSYFTRNMTKQVNAELPEPLARRVKKDAAEMGTTVNEYAKQAFEKFLTLTIDQRRIYFSDKRQRKILGRKIAV